MNWLGVLLIIIVCEIAFLGLAIWKRCHRGYHIKLHMRHRYSDAPVKPIIWNHPGPWEETVKHLPHSGTVIGDKVVEAWEIT